MDFVLLGGDLFDQSKPSRATICKTIDILNRYIMGDDPIRFQVVSDPKINFPGRLALFWMNLIVLFRECVNYESENYNIAIPVFCIHGNHDDPVGVRMILFHLFMELNRLETMLPLMFFLGQILLTTLESLRISTRLKFLQF